MGVLPLVFADGQSWQTLGLTGKEMVTIRGLAELKPRQKVAVEIAGADGKSSPRSRCCAGSIPRRRWATTATAASCRSSCATWRAPPKLQIHADTANGWRCPCKTQDTVSHPFVTRT